MSEATETTAERVARAFCDDGQRFEHPVSGQSLDAFCLDEGATVECWRVHPDGIREPVPRADATTSDRDRYLFPDGSAIVAHGDGWDLEGDAPGTWRG